MKLCILQHLDLQKILLLLIRRNIYSRYKWNIFGNSPPQMFLWKSVLKNIQESTHAEI